MKRAVLAFIMLFSMVIALPTMASAADLKIGVVDFVKALDKTEKDGVLKKLKAEIDTKQEKLRKMEKKILALQNDIKENRAVMSDAKIREKAQEYEKLALDYRKNALAFEQEVAKKRNEVLGKVQAKMSKIAVEIAKEKKLTMVIEKAAVVYSIDAYDITDELIKRYKPVK